VRVLLLVVVALAVGLAATLLPQSEWVVRAPSVTVRTGIIEPRAAETSGVAPSRANPGLLWTILDSGNPAELIALDSAGRVRGAVPLAGAENTDWEAVALGPCGTGRCVYVGDIGDNLARRAEVVLYRVAEPGPDALAGAAPVVARALRFRYPDGPRDAEALIVTPAGDAIVITKGLASAVRAYRIPAAAWERGEAATADPLGALPIEPRTAIGRWVTDAALAPDGRRAVIRTYRDIFFFELADDGGLAPGDPPILCDIAGLEPQGEGIGWADDSTLVLTSEDGRGSGAVMHRIRC
jgi:hypothetical protein